MNAKLIAALSLIAVAGVAQAKIPKDITFDGYCDGLHLEKDAATGGVSGYQIGCVSDVAGGGAAGKMYAVNNFGFVAVIRPDNTWTYYNIDGTVFNSGTWTAGAPGVAAQGTKASGQK